MCNGGNSLVQRHSTMTGSVRAIRCSSSCSLSFSVSPCKSVSVKKGQRWSGRGYQWQGGEGNGQQREVCKTLELLEQARGEWISEVCKTLELLEEARGGQ
jgi:hypothetical protein